MAEIINCSNDTECNCLCNCEAFLAENRTITVEPLVIDGNQYTFNYII